MQTQMSVKILSILFAKVTEYCNFTQFNKPRKMIGLKKSSLNLACHVINVSKFCSALPIAIVNYLSQINYLFVIIANCLYQLKLNAHMMG
jgi:hypothetical protein